ncbi:zinc finger protein 414 [Seriola lalandi dorsalis]|uniref:Zinc finger protein 414 n=1 Tax=Seriola lalandi dorsalis TaxID=1841481 RepID=A0A3B4XQS3_SERLL|nr:zinc finger protein 414 [Seriola lalandi dorsalis]
MASGSTVLQTPESGNEGNKRTSCPLHGCKRVYSDTSALESHIKDHEIPAQSLPGKTLLCSTTGCSGSFPNMQKLMEHMRHHHKPNIYFLCESCRTKLRSYRGLLTHLHTCSKVPRGKTKTTEPTPPQPAAVTNQNTTSMPMDQTPPQLDSVSKPQQLPSQIPNKDGSFPAAVPQPDSAVPPLLAPPFLSHQETSPTLLTEGVPQPLLRNGTSNLPPSLNLDVPSAAPDPSDAQGQTQTQTRSPEPVQPAPVSAPQSPPGSSAVWKKNQGMTCNRRILWEHTKGRYTCVQCGHTVTNRKEMTQHINSQHSGNKPAEDTGRNT